MERWSSGRTPTTRSPTYPYFGLDDLRGITPKLTWAPRDGGFVRFSDMEPAS